MQQPIFGHELKTMGIVPWGRLDASPAITASCISEKTRRVVML